MTCIVGIAEKGRVVIGGDSAGVGGYRVTVRSDPKVFRVGEFLIGITSSFRMRDILQYGLIPPEHPAGMETDKYIRTLFIDAVREAFKKGGYLYTNNGREQGGTWVMGYRGMVYVVHDDLQVGNPTDGFTSVGCGEEYALGSLYSTKGKPVRKRIEEALNAASYFSGGVCPPFTILESKIKQ